MMEDQQAPAMPEQGALQGCVYCGVIYPELKGNCPRCGKAGGGFRTAQMMDRDSSSRMILDVMNDLDISSCHEAEDAGAKRESLISLLKDISLYDFDIVSALALRIREMGEE